MAVSSHVLFSQKAYIKIKSKKFWLRDKNTKK